MVDPDVTGLVNKNDLSPAKKGNKENVNSTSKDCPLLLHNCVARGKKEKVQCLLNRDYDINGKDTTGTTPLMVSVTKNHHKITRLLLENGADIMMLNNENKSALNMIFEEQYFAPEIGQLFYHKLCDRVFTCDEQAQSLIDAGCRLYEACCFKNVKVIEYMLKHGFSVNSIEPFTKQSVLHIAISFHDIDSFKLLLKYGADINALDIESSAPFSYIYSTNSECIPEKLELLKIALNQENISLTTCNKYGLFQISSTLINGDREAISRVLQSNIDVTAKDQVNGKSILHYLALNTNPEIVQELKLHANKFDINVVDQSDITPLHIAVRNHNVDMTQFLLDHGARVNCKSNRYGCTALYYAYSEFNPEFGDQCDQNIELLLQRGADPQCIIITGKGNKQITIFDAAGKTNSRKKLKSVLAHSAIIEGLGVPMTSMTLNKINSCPALKKYFDRCQKLVRKKLSGAISISQLLTSNKKKIALYSRNRKLMLKLIRLRYKQNIKTFYSYYHSTLQKYFSKGIQHRKLLSVSAGVICEIFEDRLDKENLVVTKIIDYLNDESLQQLCKLSKETKM